MVPATRGLPAAHPLAYWAAMSRAPARKRIARIRVRAARESDLDALLELEAEIFATDRLSRRGLRRLIRSPSAALLVAVHDRRPAGYALVLFRTTSVIGRLYSILVDPRAAGRGIGTALLAAAEKAARTRRATSIRLEVNERNRRAIRLYERAGYRRFGRYAAYYEDGAPALRYEKPLARPATRAR